MQESLKYVTEMEKQMSQLSSANPELSNNTRTAPQVSNVTQQRSDGSRNQRGGIENNLELCNGLKEHWYPVEFSSKLKPNLLLPVELFGEKWVLFRRVSISGMMSVTWWISGTTKELLHVWKMHVHIAPVLWLLVRRAMAMFSVPTMDGNSATMETMRRCHRRSFVKEWRSRCCL